MVNERRRRRYARAGRQAGGVAAWRSQVAVAANRLVRVVCAGAVFVKRRGVR